MQSLIKSIQSLPEYEILIKVLQEGSCLPGLRIPRSVRLPLLVALHASMQQPILLITDRADQALNLYDELSFWGASTPVYHFAEPNPLFYEQAAWGIATRRERLQALTALAQYHLPFAEKPEVPPIIISSARSLMTRTIPRPDFLKSCSHIKPGGSYQIDSLLRIWVKIGYQRVNTVLEPGHFSHRGGLLDIWPPDEGFPARFDFFGDEIETIRRFDPASQRTITKLDSLLVTPAREFLLSDSPNLVNQYEYFSEFHIPLLHAMPSSLLDYLPMQSIILIDDISLVADIINDVEEQALKFRQEKIADDTLTDDFPIPYFTWSELEDTFQSHTWQELGFSTSTSTNQSSLPKDLADRFFHDKRYGGRLIHFIEYLGDLVANNDDVLIVSRQSPRLLELWEERHDIPDQHNPRFIEASLSEGFAFKDNSDRVKHLITDSEIFGWERPQPRLRQRQIAEAPESLYADLVPGDYVVHIDHGIGQFNGLLQRTLDGHQREFFAVEYRGGDILYVPVHQVDRLTRYVGPDGGPPVVNSLGGQSWYESRKRVKKAVLRVAEELLELYAHRQVVQGHAFSQDTNWQKELEDSFPYVETDDQATAIKDIKQDMEHIRPMDRLLCGDVGYGKTEVALRAAFKAVMDGKQAAMLVPTTVLAQQHYETFCQRLAAYPVKVEMLSRFRTPSEQSDILIRLALGDVDIVIGTHRLISADVQFIDLGLVIIDEEQRFGVTHKEHLKRLRTEVDVLTLTATPIPRTLYMALTGVRDISNLNTPPEERLPVVTHVGPYNPKIVRQAVLRELERGGQIFFVHNRIYTIEAMKVHIENLVPEARVEIGHGQIPEKQLAKVMHKFAAGQIDILLSTSIIESGLDIPNANTLIVDRADTFGLAQLYQLRGRVGRGAMRAYAYFFRHRNKPPTIEGQQRLEVIAENTQLGSGYSIAMRDLEIRGAGDLLGTRQHGYIAAVGFHLYTRLLADSVRRIRSQSGTHLPVSTSLFDPINLPLAMPVNVDLPLQVGIPENYILDQDLRLRLYRRIADLRDESEIDAIASEFNDRFGILPKILQNLLYQMRIKLLAEKNGLTSISMENGQIVLRYPTPPDGASSPRLADLGPDIHGGKGAYRLTFGHQPDWAQRLLEALVHIQSNN